MPSRQNVGFGGTLVRRTVEGQFKGLYDLQRGLRDVGLGDRTRTARLARARRLARGQGLRRQRREGRHVRRRAILQGSGVNAVQVRAAEQVWMTLDLLARHRRGRQIDRRHCSRCGDDGRHARRAPAALFGSRRPHQRRVASDRALSRPFVIGRCRRGEPLALSSREFDSASML
jgi:hypothetical protein